MKVSFQVEIGVLLLIGAFMFHAHGQYCDSSLCPRGNHIACGNSGRFAANCPANARVVNLSARMRGLILQMHNVRRSRVAGGNLPGYSPARRMPEVQWDNELASLALLNARQCVMRHDTCRNTPRFTRSGQNIGTTSSRGMPNRLRRHLIQTIQGWFVEYRDGNMNIINSMTNPQLVGHFTLMVNDRVTRIGCGTVRYVRNRRNTLLTTCNYASTNILNQPVYRTGTTAEGCVTGRNSDRRYPNLCSASEPVDPNAV